MGSNTVVGGGIRDIGRAVDPTTGRGLANIATGGMYELNNQASNAAKGGGGKGGDAPTPPDFTAAANEQTKANRPDQNGPFGSTSWTQDPTTGKWTQNTTLDPSLNDAAGNLKEGLDNQLDPQAQRDAAIQAAYGQATSRLDPQWAQRGAALDTSLANKGLTPGSEAFRNSMQEFSNGRNDAYSQAMYNAQTGAGNAAFGQALAGNMQPYQQLGMLNQLAQPGGYGQAGNLLAALGAQYGGQMNQYGIDQAGKNSILGGLTNLGAGALAGSDERLKQNIERLAWDAIPGVPFATWEWKHRPGEKQLGVIAQDLEKVRPDLVEMHDGVRFVNYAGLWEARNA